MTTPEIKPDTAQEISKPALTWHQKLEQHDEKLRAMQALLRGDSNSVYDALLLALNGLARAGDDEIKTAFQAGASRIMSKMERVPDEMHYMFFLEAYKDRLEKGIKVKFYSESKIEARDEVLAAQLAACKEQLKAKDAKLKSAEHFNETLCDKVKVHDVRINALEDFFKTNIKPLLEVHAKIKAKEALLSKAKDENHELRMELVALKDELSIYSNGTDRMLAKFAKGQPLACVTNA